jgi:hypothetical protein
MTDVAGAAVTKIYENTNLTVKARIDKGDVESIEEVTFKFLNDGKQFEEKAVAVSSGEDSGGQTVVSHVVKAPPVPDDRYFYYLDYHYFYKVKNADGSSESLQSFPASRIMVFARTAQLKVVDKDGKAFHGFEFRVEQDGRLGEPCKTLAGDTPNAKGESIPAGSCEFNLGLAVGFRVVPCPPYQILEDVKADGRKRELKGAVGFRARFVAPQKGTIRQFVNFEAESRGQTGFGDRVTVELGVHPEDLPYLDGIEKPAVYFRARFGPDADSAVAKSERDDDKHPTKILKPSDSDTSVTIEEKEAKKKYQGKVELKDGTGQLVASLGVAGGDTCTIEISGVEKFLTDASLPADATLQFENWRRVHYELMVPNILKDQLDASSSDFAPEVREWIDELGRLLFIEFVHDGTQVFDAVANADYGTLAPRQFFGLPETAAGVAYVLSGRNWRKPPKGLDWADRHPGKTLCIAGCDAILKWREDTQDEKAGTKDLSGTLKEATGSINVVEKFGGFLMPFSGHDAKAGVEGIHWTADIGKDDAVCKIKPELSIKEVRAPVASSVGLSVTLEAGDGLPAQGAAVVFKRLPYPDIGITDMTAPAEKDDGKLTVKESKLGQELALQFELPKESEASTAQAADTEPPAWPSDIAVLPDDDEDGPSGAARTDDSARGEARRSHSDWGPIPSVQGEDAAGSPGDSLAPPVTDAHRSQLDDFFRKLFKDGKSKLGAGPDANAFAIEIHGGKGDGRRSRRIADLQRAIRASYQRTHNHDQHDFKKDLADAHTEEIRRFVDTLLSDKVSIGMLKGKMEVILRCADDTKHGVDDCFKSVKDKLKELFDQAAKEFPFHPGLDPANDFAPREGDLELADITDIQKSSMREWHFVLPRVARDGTLGPGSFVGPSKTAEQCPVKFELAFQPHERSPGEADGNLIAYALMPSDCQTFTVALIRSLTSSEDKAAIAHGHGDKGRPGDCLKDADSLCDKCVAHGRSKDLAQI